MTFFNRSWCFIFNMKARVHTGSVHFKPKLNAFKCANRPNWRETPHEEEEQMIYPQYLSFHGWTTVQMSHQKRLSRALHPFPNFERDNLRLCDTFHLSFPYARFLFQMRFDPVLCSISKQHDVPQDNCDHFVFFHATFEVIRKEFERMTKYDNIFINI